jgi:DNA-binding NtrC family response regulator
LIVDDEQENAELLAIGFANRGFQTDTAFSISEAETKIQGDQHFDVVLSDIRMPRQDGVTLLKWIQERGGPKPVVMMMTGFSQLSECELKALGAHSLINKPLAVDAVIDIIKTAKPDSQRTSKT